MTLTMDPYTQDETDQVKARLLRGEPPTCVRCGTELSLGSTPSPDGWAKTANSRETYHCPWCGVRWVPPTDQKRRAG